MPDPLKISRRNALKHAALGAAASAVTGTSWAQENAVFAHGVASGDPLSDKVILWTRISGQSGDVTVKWQVASDADFTAIIASGQASTSPARDYTVKVDAAGLMPGTRYFYRFLLGTGAPGNAKLGNSKPGNAKLENGKLGNGPQAITSPTGRTKTLPVGDVPRATLAVCSCANYPYGFFNVYAQMAANTAIDAVVHLGDYIYEYPRGTYSDPAIEAGGRAVLPEGEATTLRAYRQRYALYRQDADLQAVHAAHPFIAIWDDHEVANDAWRGGAENHQAEAEGTFKKRRDAALKAYGEWMPTRADTRRPWRSYDFGKLARLTVLDTRIWGRDAQLDYAKDLRPTTFAFDMSDPAAPKPLLTPDARGAMRAEDIKLIAVPFDMRARPPKPVLDWNVISTFDPATAPPYLAYLPDVDRFRSALERPGRTMLGDEQSEWLGPQITGSRDRGQTWQILGQQVLMANTNAPANTNALAGTQTGPLAVQARRLGQLGALGLPLNLDAWDGYPAARQRLFDMLRAHGANPVVLAGDTHNCWVSELVDAKGPLGYEFGATSVSSPGLGDYFSQTDPEAIASGLMDSTPSLKWMEAAHRGYTTLSFTAATMDVTYHLIDTAKSRAYAPLPPVTFRITAGKKPGEAQMERLS